MDIIDNNIVAELERLAEFSRVDGHYTHEGVCMQTAASLIRALTERNYLLEDRLCQIEYIVAGALR
jgi:hypothetical protein